MQQAESMTFRCKSCGAMHDIGDISFGAGAPAVWDLLSDEEKRNSELGGEQCVINDRDGNTSFFVRACLLIPIQGEEPKNFDWGVWASLSEKSFLEMSEHWEDPERVRLGPYFGWLHTPIPCYPDTMYLKTMVHHRAVGKRPVVVLEPTDHLLALHQRQGIPPADLKRIIEKVLHDSS
ncbi:MAG: DUF2199 domain-containing protein [Myxococcales bacterium]